MLVAAAAQASALQECRRSEPDGANLVPCLRRAREAATEEMLAAFLDVQRAAEAAAAPEAARAALKQSQRAFERYLSEHCHGAQPAFAAAPAALLACEVDLLRQRAEVLQALDIGARGF
ncbi:MAG: lysozyme inhibitor LprI family protein [Burkholderiaceae bacterium]|nr:lysozyme inhibitor LprI family protein [Burkholderiaceae bacterium]